MKELIKDIDRLYKLYEDGEELVLSVVCGGIGMYEVKMVLVEDEKVSYKEQGKSFLDNLVYDIGKDQTKYIDRLF